MAKVAIWVLITSNDDAINIASILIQKCYGDGSEFGIWVIVSETLKGCLKV